MGLRIEKSRVEHMCHDVKFFLTKLVDLSVLPGNYLASEGSDHDTSFNSNLKFSTLSVSITHTKRTFANRIDSVSITI